MAPQTSPPQSTPDRPKRASDPDSPLDTDGTRDAHAAPSIPELCSIGGLLVVYLAALTALGVRRAVLWPLSTNSDRGSVT
ncbi:hypothetical protein [Halobellus limi]|uniref:Uncharacterized protein n=1 Tax=Halobellus limi TaxID=699433 RepID=A0A1H5TWM3_9EURY|nr:hypothetical protein [Halobellus limi]QCC47217.1 hypothetical protein DV707_05745 [Halobellus limi]SEF67150.1 hypothetical protein SAMN04488133_0402 [Halobellus limi]